MISMEDSELHAYLKKARTAFQHGEYESAAEIFKCVTDSAPHFLDAEIGLFETMTKLGELTAARVHLDRAIALSPGNVELRITRSEIAINAGEHAVASDDLASAITLAPALTPLWIGYLSALTMGFKPEEALLKFRSLGLEPPNDLLLSVELANVELNAGERSTAEQRINAIVAENKQDPDLQILRATFLMAIGEDAEGQAVFNHLRTLAPKSVSILLAAAFSELHDNASVYKALADLQRVLVLQPDNTDALRMSAEGLARIARYSDALGYLKRYLKLCGTEEPEDTFFYAKLLTNNNISIEASEAFDTTANQLLALLKESLNDKVKANVITAKLARVEIARGRKVEAKRLFHSILSSGPKAPHNYCSSLYFSNTKRKIKSLKRVIGGRDVFLLAHGPSISELSNWIERFAESDICIAAVGAFRVLETEILKKVDRNVEIVLQTHYRSIAPRYDQLENFLNRNEDNLFITARWALDRLGRSCPTRQEIEHNFGHKILYFGGSEGMQPATPDNPLRFVFGNSLSMFVPLISMGGANRIFIFGADGVAPNDLGKVRHFGQDSPDYRYDFDATDMNALTGALRADTIDFDEAVEIGIMSLEALFDFERPPIFNVSHGSAITAFPKIDYDTAWSMLTTDSRAKT
jgi:predicted Zn-dependent protease